LINLLIREGTDAKVKLIKSAIPSLLFVINSPTSEKIPTVKKVKINGEIIRRVATKGEKT
jgi:hypothetical protein